MLKVILSRTNRQRGPRPKFNREGYASRIPIHLEHAQLCIDDGDFIQAGEKIWGAITAIINIKAGQEVKSSEDKESMFIAILGNATGKDGSIQAQMYKNGWRSERDVYRTARELHAYFYGASKNWTDPLLKVASSELLDIISKLTNVA